MAKGARIGARWGLCTELGTQQKVIIAVDLGVGQPMEVGYVDEHDPQAVRRWLEPLVQRLGVSVIVTDDLMTYHLVTEKLALEHQVCQFHIRRWVGKALKELRESLPEEWLWVLDQIKQLMDDLTPDGSRRLLELYKQLPACQSAKDQPRTPIEQLRLW